MEEITEALEEHAGRLSEDLSTEAAVLQVLANKTQKYSENSPEYNLGVKRLQYRLNSFASDHVEAKSVLAITERADLGLADEQREEEVRLAKEKYFSSMRENPYSGKVEEAINSHRERQSEARTQEILAHGTSIVSLRNTLDQYEEVLSELEEYFPEINTGINYEGKDYDSEIIEETDNTPEIEKNWEKGSMWETI